MAEKYEFKGFDGTNWNIPFDVASNERLVFFGAQFGNPIEVGSFQMSSHRTDAAVGSDLCFPNHVRNCQYVGPSQVDIGAGPIDLTGTLVSLNHCTVRILFQNDDVAPSPVETSAASLFAYNAIDPAIAPTDARLVAFERTLAGAIGKDNPIGSGLAWNSAYGIGGYSRRLLLADQGPTATHYWFVGISLSPLNANPSGEGMLRVQLNYV